MISPRARHLTDREIEHSMTELLLSERDRCSTQFMKVLRRDIRLLAIEILRRNPDLDAWVVFEEESS